jgi:hypothetical protein
LEAVGDGRLLLVKLYVCGRRVLLAIAHDGTAYLHAEE